MPTTIDLRVQQANERTLLAWIRTGLAFMGFGYVIERLALGLELAGESAALALGISAVVLGSLFQLVGASRFIGTRRALLEGRDLVASGRTPLFLAFLAAANGIALLCYLLFV